MTCKDCIHEKVCKNAYLFKVTPPNVCGYFKNKADYAEVKHGEWIEKTNTYNYSDEDFEYLECSICGNCSPVQYSSPYCSECGAKMDGDKK